MRQLDITSDYSYISIYARRKMSTRYFSLCLSFGSSPDTNHHKTLVSNRVKGGEGIKGYNEDTMNTIKLGKLAKDLKNFLHFIKFFWFAMFTRNDYSNTCQIKIKANSRISFLGCNIDWRYTPWFLWVINIPVSFSFIWNFSPYHLIELIGRKKLFNMIRTYVFIRLLVYG